MSRTNISRVAALAVTAAASAVITATPAWAGTVAPGSPSTAPQLLISTVSGNIYSIDTSSTDACQAQPGGLSAWAADSPITMTPDGTVWTSSWENDSEAASVGTFNPASANWVSAPASPGPAAPHDVAGLLAMNDTTGIATSYYSHNVMTVDFKTGEWKVIGDTANWVADGLAWAPNGDLLMAGDNNHIYRLPAATLTAGIGGTYFHSSDWLDLGDAVTPSTVTWYNPFTWGNGGSRIYGLATGPDGTLYVATKKAGIYTLAAANLPTNDDSSRALELQPFRSFPSGACGNSDTIDGMTITGDTLFAPASADSTQASVTGTAGTPITGTVTSTAVQAPVTVTAENALPAGVALASDGTLSGTPVAAGTTNTTVKVCGQDTCVTKQLTLTIAGAAATSTSTGTGTQKPPPADPTMALDGYAGEPVSGTLPGSLAAAPSTFTVTDTSKLPQGVSIDSTGNLMGIPVTAGSYAIPVKACNATGCTTGTATLTIAPSEFPCDQGI